MKPIIVAHRGASFGSRSTTLAAFERAVAGGAEMVEFDVRLTADRELLVFHDSHVDGVPVSELALADIQAAYASENQRLPLLGELVEIARGRATLNVEVKEPGYEVEVLKALQVVEPTRPPMITSFRDRALTTIRRLA